jgi:hypothetical protein
MKKPVRLYNCIPMTAERLKALQELARHPNGSAAIRGVLEGAHLATLVAMGLAERLPAQDRMGGSWYRCTADGQDLAGVADASGARTGAAND